MPRQFLPFYIYQKAFNVIHLLHYSFPHEKSMYSKLFTHTVIYQKNILRLTKNYAYVNIKLCLKNKKEYAKNDQSLTVMLLRLNTISQYKQFAENINDERLLLGLYNLFIVFRQVFTFNASKPISQTQQDTTQDYYCCKQV